MLAFALPAAVALALLAALALALPAALAADNNVQKTPITKTKTEKVCRRHYIGRDVYKRQVQAFTEAQIFIESA